MSAPYPDCAKIKAQLAGNYEKLQRLAQTNPEELIATLTKGLKDLDEVVNTFPVDTP